MSDKNVARWTTADIQPAEHGGFVCYGDYLTLERENAALTARVAELERDAGRYRWLRTPKVGHHQVMFWMSEPARYVSLDWNELDAAIDAARGTE